MWTWSRIIAVLSGPNCSGVRWIKILNSCIIQQDVYCINLPAWLCSRRLWELNWPTCSPDFLPSENIWLTIIRKIKHHRPRTLYQIFIFISISDKNETAKIQQLVLSVPRCYAEVNTALSWHFWNVWCHQIQNELNLLLSFNGNFWLCFLRSPVNEMCVYEIYRLTEMSRCLSLRDSVKNVGQPVTWAVLICYVNRTIA